MTTVMKVQLNIKIDNESNISFSFEHMVTDEDDAKELGEQDKLLVDAWTAGYSKTVT